MAPEDATALVVEGRAVSRGQATTHPVPAIRGGRASGKTGFVAGEIVDPVSTWEEVGVTQGNGPVEEYLEAIEGAAMADCDALSPKITLDATVPNWRFTVQGDDAVRAELGRWYADQGSFEELKRTPLPSGELVEFTLRWEEGGVPHAVHQVHILEVTDAGITRDQVWCGGRWSATLLAEMAGAGDGSA
jgi:hypothetical protein